MKQKAGAENYVSFAYDEVKLEYSYWNRESRIKTFSSQESFDKVMAKEMVYQKYYIS